MTADQISVASVRQDDLPAIMELERSSFSETEQWSERSWQGEILAERRTLLIARSYRPVGVIALQTIDRSADLQRIMVAPAHRRSGVAVELVRAGVEAVRHQGARSVMLEVRFDNDPAIELYQRLGFEQLAAREHYYGRGKHALILKLWDTSKPVELTEVPVD